MNILSVKTVIAFIFGFAERKIIENREFLAHINTFSSLRNWVTSHFVRQSFHSHFKGLIKADRRFPSYNYISFLTIRKDKNFPNKTDVLHIPNHYSITPTLTGLKITRTHFGSFGVSHNATVIAQGCKQMSTLTNLVGRFLLRR